MLAPCAVRHADAALDTVRRTAMLQGMAWGVWLTHTMKRSHSAHLGVSEATGRLLTWPPGLPAPGGAKLDVAAVGPDGAGEGAEGATPGAGECEGVWGRAGAGEQERPPTAWLCVAKYVVEAGRSADTPGQTGA